MAMLRSAVGLALRQSAPAARFCGNVGRRNPAYITTTRNYEASMRFEFSKEDFTGWTGVEFMIGVFSCGVGLVFRHYTTPPYKRNRGTIRQAVKQNPLLILVSMDNMDERKQNREQHV